MLGSESAEEDVGEEQYSSALGGLAGNDHPHSSDAVLHNHRIHCQKNGKVDDADTDAEQVEEQLVLGGSTNAEQVEEQLVLGGSMNAEQAEANATRILAIGDSMNAEHEEAFSVLGDSTIAKQVPNNKSDDDVLDEEHVLVGGLFVLQSVPIDALPCSSLDQMNRF